MTRHSTTADATPPLPPDGPAAGRLLVVPGPVVRRYEPEDVLVDAVRTLAPDALVPAGTDEPLVRQRLAALVDVPVVTAARGMTVRTVTAASVRFVVPPTLSALPATPSAVADGATDTTVWCLISDTVSLDVDPHRRRARLDGARAYAETLPDAWLSSDVVHLSTALRAGHSRSLPDEVVDADVVIHGTGTSRARLGVASSDAEHDLTAIDVYPNGAVTSDDIRPDAFGLRGLRGVGDARASALRRGGFDDVDAVAEASVRDLARVADVGETTAATVQASARARAEGAVVPTGDDPFPDGDPIFLDIETDGLAASVAWLVGVLDGDAETGSYYPFRQRDLSDPGAHLEAFMTWLNGTARTRPVVAWNGYGFDFDIITEQLREHRPSYVDDWTDRYTFDPLYWARTERNAALPGRTNSVEPVAAALGWEPTVEGVDGETTARAYRVWRDRVQRAGDPSGVWTPDWDRFETYCEDDVRALATVYEALRAASRREPETRTATGSDSRQGSLSEFGR